jgi:hypothetical protein
MPPVSPSFLPCFSTLPSALPFCATLPSPRPRRGFFFPTHPTTLFVGAVLFLSFYLRHPPPTGRPRLPRPRVRCPSSLCTMCARAYRISYILSTRGVGGRLFFFLLRDDEAGLRSWLSSSESEIMSAFGDFVFFPGFFFLDGNFDFRVLFEIYVTPCACARALLVYFIFLHFFFPIF